MRNLITILMCVGLFITFCGCKQKPDAPPETPDDSQTTEPVTIAEPVEEVKPAGPMELTISFKTTSTRGRYSPRNAQVVWVEAVDGSFVKTLDLWAMRYAGHLTQWAKTVPDMNAAIQARTGASERAYGSYTSRWDLKDADGNEVPDGDYVIRFELTSDNAPANNYHRASIPFTKDGAPATTESINKGGYQNIVLDYQAAATE